MCQCFAQKKDGALPLFIVSEFSDCGLTPFEKAWVEAQSKNTEVFLVPSQQGYLAKVICKPKTHSMWVGAVLYEGLRSLDHTFYVQQYGGDLDAFCLSWALAAYDYAIHKTQKERSQGPKLYLETAHKHKAERLYEAVALVRDLVNAPASILIPQGLAEKGQEIGRRYGAQTQIVSGDRLQKEYPMVWAVGRASEHAPAVLDLTWGNEAHPKVALVGKGVTFDSGGLDIKPAQAMLLMKKDMGGAAHALALAQLIMAEKLPFRLRLILPCAENAIGSRSFRPSDVLTSRKGMTVEVGDTDAEGRLLLADALAAVSEDEPHYILNFATLTGVARLAVGTEIGALFANDPQLQTELVRAGDRTEDPLWPLPLWNDYLKLLKSDVADIKSCSAGGYAGAITAALFLQKFVSPEAKWAHFDIMSWNVSHRPGRPVGGDAMGLRAAYDFLQSLNVKD